MRRLVELLTTRRYVWIQRVDPMANTKKTRVRVNPWGQLYCMYDYDAIALDISGMGKNPKYSTFAYRWKFVTPLFKQGLRGELALWLLNTVGKKEWDGPA